MKKNLFKVSTFTFLCFSLNLCSQNALHSFEQTNENVSGPTKNQTKTLGNHQLTQMYGLQNETNFKTYHCGLKALDPNHHIPTETELFTEITSHPFYLGVISETMRKNEAKKIIKQKNIPYFIYQTNSQEKNHFYLAHAKGIRHFSVKGKKSAWFDNGAINFYPSLKNSIDCTIS